MDNVNILEHIIYLIKRYENEVDVNKNIFGAKQLKISLTQENIFEEQIKDLFDEYSQNIENLTNVYIEKIKSILKEKK